MREKAELPLGYGGKPDGAQHQSVQPGAAHAAAALLNQDHGDEAKTPGKAAHHRGSVRAPPEKQLNRQYSGYVPALAGAKRESDFDPTGLSQSLTAQLFLQEKQFIRRETVKARRETLARIGALTESSVGALRGNMFP
jgi:hypothetical protein